MNSIEFVEYCIIAAEMDTASYIKKKYQKIETSQTMYLMMFDALILDAINRDFDDNFIEEIIEYRKVIENSTEKEIIANSLPISEKYFEYNGYIYISHPKSIDLHQNQ